MARAQQRSGEQRLEIGAVRVDHDLQPRAAINDEVVEEYAAALEAGASFPPVTVIDDGETFWLADGFHRHAASVRAKRTTILCDVRPGARRDAVLTAACANGTHGLRRTNADKRRAVSVLLRDPEWVAWSDRKIASTLGVDHRFVGHLREELGAGRDVRLVERGGTTFERRNPVKLEPQVEPEPTPPAAPVGHPLRTPQTIGECKGLPLSLLSRAGAALSAAGAPCLPVGGRIRCSTMAGTVVLERGREPYDWHVVAEVETQGGRTITHVGGTMRKASVSRVLHLVAAAQFELVEALATTPVPQRPESAPETRPPVRKSRIPAPKPAPAPAPVEPEPEPEPEPEAVDPLAALPDVERRTWTVLTSLSEAMTAHLARMEACWKAGAKEILALAKAGARPLRPVELADLRKGDRGAVSEDEVFRCIGWLRRRFEDLTPYRRCGCPPERQSGGGGNVHGGTSASYCLDCSGRGWLSRSQAQYLEGKGA